MRKVAVHRLWDGDNALDMAVIEIVDGYVRTWYAFEGEIAMTEWLGGEAWLQRNENGKIQLLINNKILC